MPLSYDQENNPILAAVFEQNDAFTFYLYNSKDRGYHIYNSPSSKFPIQFVKVDRYVHFSTMEWDFKKLYKSCRIFYNQDAISIMQSCDSNRLFLIKEVNCELRKIIPSIEHVSNKIILGSSSYTISIRLCKSESRKFFYKVAVFDETITKGFFFQRQINYYKIYNFEIKYDSNGEYNGFELDIDITLEENEVFGYLRDFLKLSTPDEVFRSNNVSYNYMIKLMDWDVYREAYCDMFNIVILRSLGFDTLSQAFRHFKSEKMREIRNAELEAERAAIKRQQEQALQKFNEQLDIKFYTNHPIDRNLDSNKLLQKVGLVDSNNRFIRYHLLNQDFIGMLFDRLDLDLHPHLLHLEIAISSLVFHKLVLDDSRKPRSFMKRKIGDSYATETYKFFGSIEIDYECRFFPTAEFVNSILETTIDESLIMQPNDENYRCIRWNECTKVIDYMFETGTFHTDVIIKDSIPIAVDQSYFIEDRELKEEVYKLNGIAIDKLEWIPKFIPPRLGDIYDPKKWRRAYISIIAFKPPGQLKAYVVEDRQFLASYRRVMELHLS